MTKLIKKVKTVLPNNKTAGELQVGSFVKLKGENFFRRVNSDGTLTKVEDGNNGTIDFRNTPKKVLEQTSWRIALANSVDPTGGYPGFLTALKYRSLAKNKQNSPDILTRDYNLNTYLDSVSNAAWRKYLGLEYDKSLLPKGEYDNLEGFKENTVKLSPRLEKEIPVDTNFLKSRILSNLDYLNRPLPRSDELIRAVNSAILIDSEALSALRYTYLTGNPIGMYEHSFNSRQLIDQDGNIDLSLITNSPLNVFQSYNIRYDKPTNRMYYSKTYNFDGESPWWSFGGFDKYLGGTPFRFRGYIDLNK